MVAVEQHAQLQGVAAFRVVHVITQGVDGLDLRLRYRHRLDPRDPTGDRNPSNRLAGYKRVGWTGQVVGGRATVPVVGTAEGQPDRIEQRRRKDVAFRHRRRLASARTQRANAGKGRAGSESPDVVGRII